MPLYRRGSHIFGASDSPVNLNELWPGAMWEGLVGMVGVPQSSSHSASGIPVPPWKLSTRAKSANTGQGADWVSRRGERLPKGPNPAHGDRLPYTRRLADRHALLKKVKANTGGDAKNMPQWGKNARKPPSPGGQSCLGWPRGRQQLPQGAEAADHHRVVPALVGGRVHLLDPARDHRHVGQPQLLTGAGQPRGGGRPGGGEEAELPTGNPRHPDLRRLSPGARSGSRGRRVGQWRGGCPATPARCRCRAAPPARRVAAAPGPGCPGCGSGCQRRGVAIVRMRFVHVKKKYIRGRENLEWFT